MKFLTVTGFKGGVGKTTTAIHLATFFSDHGKTLLVDGDPNRSSISWSNRGSLPFTVGDERKAMRLVEGMDYVIFDTPARPDSDDLKELAEGCDLLVLPTAPDVLSLEAMLQTAEHLKGSTYRALITIAQPYPSKEGQNMRRDLQVASIPVFNTMIRRSAGFQKTALEGVPLRDYSERRLRAAWQDYEDLGNEIMETIA